MSSTKMKSLLKGLRYISQVFAIEGEKEQEMQIGNPTDVKHVAHIGWDGPSDNATAPSWMNDFKSSPGIESTTQLFGEDDSSVKCQSEFGGRSRDLPKLPKSTRKSSSEKGSPTKEKSDKTKRRTSNKGTSSSRRTKDEDSTSSSRRPKDEDSTSSSRRTKDEDSSWSQHSVGLPEIPKKSKRKKSKEGGNGGSSRSSRISEADKMSDYMSDTGSVRSIPQFEDDRNGF